MALHIAVLIFSCFCRGVGSLTSCFICSHVKRSWWQSSHALFMKKDGAAVVAVGAGSIRPKEEGCRWRDPRLLCPFSREGNWWWDLLVEGINADSVRRVRWVVIAVGLAYVGEISKFFGNLVDFPSPIFSPSPLFWHSVVVALVSECLDGLREVSFEPW